VSWTVGIGRVCRRGPSERDEDESGERVTELQKGRGKQRTNELLSSQSDREPATPGLYFI
jgi:hypothetical protein